MGEGKRFFIGLIILGAGFGLRYMFSFVTTQLGSGPAALPMNLGDIVSVFSLIFIVLGGGIMALVLTKVIFRKIKESISSNRKGNDDRKPYSERIQERRRREPMGPQDDQR